jgi:hypothetical protein
VSDSNPLFEAVFDGCASQVSTLAGVELTPGEVSISTSSEAPEGDLAVLPIVVVLGQDSEVTLIVSSPLSEVVAIARRMGGESSPDEKEEEISAEDLSAAGEVLNSVSAVVDQALRENVRSDLEGRPETWWRTNDPGDHSFPDGEFVVGEAALADPDGTAFTLQVRVPPGLLELAATGVRKKSGPGRVLLAGLSEEIKTLVEKVVTAGKGEVVAADPEDPGFLRTCASADCVVLAGESAFERCRELRIADATWQVATVICLEEPTQESVLQALDCGVSRVLRTPCSAAELKNTLRSVRS